MDTHSAVRTLRLFNDKADKLKSLSFFQKTFNQNTGFNLSWHQGGPPRAERRGPDAESIDAFVLTLRFFVQDNEPTSLRNMARLYAQLPIAEAAKQDFRKARAAINKSLATATFVRFEGRQLMKREVFDVFLWGGLAHANQDKKALYDKWRGIHFLFPILENEFIVMLADFLNAIFYARGLNESALRELGETP